VLVPQSYSFDVSSFFSFPLHKLFSFRILPLLITLPVAVGVSISLIWSVKLNLMSNILNV
jgi:hypothetical protein